MKQTQKSLIKTIIITFIEGFLGVTSSTFLLDIKDLNTFKIFLSSGIIAGISAVIHLLKLRFLKE